MLNKTFLTLIGLVAFLSLVASVVTTILRRATAHRKESEERAADRFEGAMLRQFGAEPSNTARESTATVATARPVYGGAAESTPPGIPAVQAAPSTVGQRPTPETSTPSTDADTPPEVQNVLRRLEGLGLVAAVEEPLAMTDASGMGRAIRLKDGERALILPAPEAPEALSQRLRAFKYVFTILPDGTVATSSRLDDFLSDRIDVANF